MFEICVIPNPDVQAYIRAEWYAYPLMPEDFEDRSLTLPQYQETWHPICNILV